MLLAGLSWRFRKKAVLAGLSVMLLAGGSLHYLAAMPSEGPDSVSFHNETGTVTLSGYIETEVEIRDTTQHLRVSVTEMVSQEAHKTVSGDVLLFVPRYPEFRYGDEVRVAGNLENPPVFRDDLTGETKFDYAAFLALQDIYSVMVYPSVEVISHDNGSFILAGIYSLKQELSLSLARVLPEPQSSLSRGVLLGMRQGIPEDIKDDFSHTGSFHLLAISGLHMGIVAAMVLSITRGLLGRRYYLYVWLALLAVWFYAVISGANPPVIRAAIMTSTFLFAELSGRQRNALPALGLAAGRMTAFNPQIAFTASFQMSFAAMSGIILLYPGLRSWSCGLIPEAVKRRALLHKMASMITESFSVSLAATAAVAPLIVYYFGIFSSLGPLITLVVLPALVALIVCSGAAAFSAFVLPLVSVLAGYGAWLFGSYILVVVRTAAGWEFAYADGIDFPPAALFVYYAGLVFCIWVWSKRSLVRNWIDSRNLKPLVVSQSGLVSRRLLLTCALFCLMVSSAAAPLSCKAEEQLQVHFLDVGQGDAILLTYGSKQVLVDGGPSPQALLNELGSKMPFWDRTIELVVLTHSHSDHINGLLEVLQRYEVGHVLYPETPVDPGQPGHVFNRWLKLIKQHGIDSTVARAGQYFYLGDALVTVLNPPGQLFEGTHSDLDNNSVVLNIEYGRFDFMLTGDLMWQGELDMVLTRLVNQADLLKVGHHGSRTSSSSEFLAVVRPGAGVICVGQNTYGHPHEEVVARLESFMPAENVWRTDKLDGVSIITDGQRIWLRQP